MLSLQQAAELSSKNTLLLELLGEREEEVDDLRAELEDAKAMFRAQLEELVTRLAAHEHTNTSNSNSSSS
jgi:TATA element modulatory factor 1 TATA binding